ncbi:hypothetical protein DVH24_002876 [Malus domestica]|uniref:Secreted protein n=1 Tax=Malus domestica TaxID=3750 RepID=A0A498K5X7_MALDO|nr:hypothetical protein DVH24_002876 [Malus domestica]
MASLVKMWCTLIGCSIRVPLVRGTGRDGAGRGVPSRVWCAKNGWNGLFHGTDFGCFCVPPPPWNGNNKTKNNGNIKC